MSNAEKYSGVLLAAGKGSRMAAFSSHIPKPMLPVGNKPLLVHQIEMLREVGITDIVVLIGHKGFEWSKQKPWELLTRLASWKMQWRNPS